MRRGRRAFCRTATSTKPFGSCPAEGTQLWLEERKAGPPFSGAPPSTGRGGAKYLRWRNSNSREAAAVSPGSAEIPPTNG